MKPLIVGVGRAGCRIANEFFERKTKVEYEGLLLDTDKAHLKFYQHKHRLLIGESIVDGNGTGRNLELGRRIMKDEALRIIEHIDAVKEHMDCLLVISSFGGGTGGAVDLLIEELKRNYSEPVYHIGVLPSEEDLVEDITNFRKCFKAIVSKSDACFPVDNDLLRENLRLKSQYSYINDMVFKYLNNIFEIGEYRAPEELGSNVLAEGDVINSLSGISTIGVGEKRIEDIDTKLDKPELVVALTEKAVKNTLVKVDFTSAKKALVVVSGEKRYLDFLGSIPARLWVENNMQGEVRGGDLPSSRRNLQVAVLLSGIRRSDRLKYLYRLGEVVEKSRGEIPAGVKEDLHQLIKKIDELREISIRISREIS